MNVMTALGTALTALTLAIGVGAAHTGTQDGASATRADASASMSFEVLKGKWVRPDGGYVIAISGVAADGKLDTAYANPRPLPFAVAQAQRDGKMLKVFLELRAGGYNGSTYSLVHDPVHDVLRGVYFQAVSGQRYDVQFARMK